MRGGGECFFKIIICQRIIGRNKISIFINIVCVLFLCFCFYLPKQLWNGRESVRLLYCPFRVKSHA